MPIYEYQAVEGGCEYCGRPFEAMQKMSDPPVTACPECDAPVRRVVSAVSFKTSSETQTLSRDNIAKHGFARYERSGKGTYERTAGAAGPDRLSKNSLPDTE